LENLVVNSESRREGCPAIVITATDRERLMELARQDLTRTATDTVDAARFLAREIERAEVIAGVEHPPSLVVMDAVVEFVQDRQCIVRRAKLVYPESAGQAGCISVLSPVGAALLGLGPGQSMTWRDGESDRCVEVLSVGCPRGSTSGGGGIRPAPPAVARER
jgi:regulator of nucleoside diphosphate kinase